MSNNGYQEVLWERYGSIASDVRELLRLPGARERFQQHRKNWRYPVMPDIKTGDIPQFNKTDGLIELPDKYVWLALIHDLCYPDDGPIILTDGITESHLTTESGPLIVPDDDKNPDLYPVDGKLIAFYETAAITLFLYCSAAEASIAHIRWQLDGFIDDVRADLAPEKPTEYNSSDFVSLGQALTAAGRKKLPKEYNALNRMLVKCPWIRRDPQAKGRHQRIHLGDWLHFLDIFKQHRKDPFEVLGKTGEGMDHGVLQYIRDVDAEYAAIRRTKEPKPG